MKLKIALIFVILAVWVLDTGDAWRRRWRVGRVFRRVTRKIGRVVRKVVRGTRKLVRGAKKIFKFGKKVVKNWSEIKKAIGCFKTIMSLVKTFGDTSIEDLKSMRDTDLEEYNAAMERLQDVTEEEYGSDAEDLLAGFDIVMDLDAEELQGIMTELDENELKEDNTEDQMFNEFEA